MKLIYEFDPTSSSHLKAAQENLISSKVGEAIIHAMIAIWLSRVHEHEYHLLSWLQVTGGRQLSIFLFHVGDFELPITRLFDHNLLLLQALPNGVWVIEYSVHLLQTPASCLDERQIYDKDTNCVDDEVQEVEAPGSVGTVSGAGDESIRH